jgi:hypothetical protein
MNIDVARVAEVVTHIIATCVAWQRVQPGRVDFTPTLQPLRRFLLITLIADAARALGQHFVLQHAARPFAGLARIAFHTDQVGVIGWSAGLVMLVVLAFTGRENITSKLLPIASFAAGIAISFAHAYPELREQKLGLAYLIVQIATVFVGVAFVARAWLQGRWFGVAVRAVTVLLVGDIATICGPFLGSPFEHWATANAISAVTFVVLAWELRHSRTVVA